MHAEEDKKKNMFDAQSTRVVVLFSRIWLYVVFYKSKLIILNWIFLKKNYIENTWVQWYRVRRYGWTLHGKRTFGGFPSHVYVIKNAIIYFLGNSNSKL